MRLVCDHCSSRTVGSRVERFLEFDQYHEWISHLLTKNHQAKVEETLLTGNKRENNRFIVVTGFTSPAPKPLEVIDYFQKFGMICEFYSHRDMKFCMLRIDPFVSNIKAWKTTEGHVIRGQHVRLLEKAAMTPADWELVNPKPTQNGPTSSTEIESIQIQVKGDSRRVTAMTSNSLLRDEDPHPQAEIVESFVVNNRNVPLDDRGSTVSQGTSQASSVTSNGFEVPEKKKSRSRKKNKKDGESETHRKQKEIGCSVPACLAAPLENHQVTKTLENLTTITKTEVQFRGGFNSGPRSLYPPAAFASAPSTCPAALKPLPQHNPGLASVHYTSDPAPVVKPLPQHNPRLSFINQNSPQVQTHGNPRPRSPQIQQANRVQAPPMTRNRQEMNRPPQLTPIQRPPSPYYQQYGQRMLNMPYNEAQKYAQQRNMHPVLPPGAFPNNAQSVRPHINSRYQPQPSYRNEPLPKFINLFYAMVNDPAGGRRSQLWDAYEALPLKDQFREFLLALSLDENGKRNRDGMLQNLQSILITEYPHCIVYPFGSFLTGLGDLESDVDVYIDAFGVTKGRQPPKTESSAIDILNRCQRILRRAKCPQSNRAFCNQLIPIREARVPILKLRHSLTSVNCDLSFENLISVRNSELINLYMKLHPVVRPLIILIRYWGKFHNLTGSNSIKNYGLILLVLVFLGIKKVVPTVASLQKIKKYRLANNVGMDNPDIIEGWDTYFAKNVEEIKSAFPSSLSLEEAGSNLVGAVGKLAEDFFDLYAKENLTNSVICSYTSEFLKRSLFTAGNEEDLPEALDRYKEWSARQISDRRLNIKTPLCIQDPFILSFNVGAVTPNGVLLKFQVACAQTVKHLQSSKFISLLDAFVPLPKEIGDNKFMSMQKRQTVTKELCKEINSYVLFGTTDETETPDFVPEEEIVPFHLLPIQKIICKSTIRYGKGWESFSSFQPNKEFQKAFVQEVKSCKLLSIYQPSMLLEKLKILWIGFVEDFLLEFWVKCLKLEVIRQERIKIERNFADPPFSVKTRKNYETIFGEREKKDKKNAPNEYDIDCARVELLKTKLTDLGDIHERILYQKLSCTHYQPFWQKREKVFKQVVSNLLPDDSKQEPSGQVAEDPSKPVKIIKVNTKKKKKVKIPEAVSINPLDIEEEVTNIILKNCKSDAAETSIKKPLLKFVSFVKFDCSLVDELPEIFFVFEKADECMKSTYEQGGAAIVEILSNSLPEYLLYRLNQWLQEGNEAAKVKPESEPIVAETESDSWGPELSKAETTYEEECDLLMPPSSSSSECSDTPIPEDVEF